MSVKHIVPIKAQNSFLSLQTDPMLKSLTRLPEAGSRFSLIEDNYGKIVTGIPEEERKDLEKELGLKDGELSPSSEFWRISPAFKGGIVIPAEGVTWDLKDPNDRIKWYLLQGYDILQTGPIREAKHEFFVKDEEMELKASSEKLTKKKFLYLQFANWDVKAKRDFLFALGIKNLGVSELKMDDIISNKIESQTAQLYELLKDTRYKTIVMVEKLLATAVITYSPQLFRYEFEGEALAESKDKLLAVFANKDEKTGLLVQRLKDVYLERIKSNEYVDLASETDFMQSAKQEVSKV
ncbi:MAG: hypothetical protein EBU90_01560 [Proteobacteria bacterium]|nr:hypothetical protein [Pseudomonadota bacterium]